MWWRWQQNCTWRCHLWCNWGSNMAGNNPVVRVYRKLYTSRHTRTQTPDFRTLCPEGTLCHQGWAYEKDTAGCQGPHHVILIEADFSGRQSSRWVVVPRGREGRNYRCYAAYDRYMEIVDIHNFRDYWVFGLRPSSGFLKNTAFWKLGIFPSSGEGVWESFTVGSDRKSWLDLKLL
jgi:hypothetical protein